MGFNINKVFASEQTTASRDELYNAAVDNRGGTARRSLGADLCSILDRFVERGKLSNGIVKRGDELGLLYVKR